MKRFPLRSHDKFVHAAINTVPIRALFGMLFSLISIHGHAAEASMSEPAAIVHTHSGALLGSEADSVRAFKGIPYAEPPVGDLRWKAPVAPLAWKGTRDATQFGADCMQKPLMDTRAPTMSEDCLSLNVWAPATGKHLPVMVWAYGGSFLEGSGSLPLYDGTQLAKRGVIVVTFNYRMGVFGFLAHRGLAAESPKGVAGNYGILDAIQALRWVKQNIAAFNGDPNRVTVFGESSGASLLDLVMVSPLSKNLFQQAILQSPGAMRPLSTLQEAEKSADVVGADISALRAMPASQLLALNGKIVPAVRRLTTPRALGPILDGWVLPRTDTEAFATGQIPHVPMIVGGNSDEGRLFTTDWPIHTPEEAADYASKNFGDSAHTMVSLYQLNDPSHVSDGLAYAFGDTQFNYGVRGIAQGMSAQEPRVWRYLFTHRPAGEDTPPTHSEELDYVFGTLGAPRFVKRGPMTAADRQLSDAMMGAWVRFARTGNPNGGTLSKWPRYDKKTDPYFVFGDAPAVRYGYRTDYLNFVGDFLHSSTSSNNK